MVFGIYVGKGLLQENGEVLLFLKKENAERWVEIAKNSGNEPLKKFLSKGYRIVEVEDPNLGAALSVFSELAEFKAISHEDSLQKSYIAAAHLQQAAGSMSADELEKFNAENEHMVFELTRAEGSEKQRRKDLLSNLRKSDKVILDYFCGIGSFGIQILESSSNTWVDFVEPNKPCYGYLGWRISERIIKKTIRSKSSSGGQKLPAGTMYDAILFCLNVSGRIGEPEKHLKVLRERMLPGAILVIDPSMVENQDLAMDGFKKISDSCYQKDDGTAASKSDSAGPKKRGRPTKAK